MIYRIEADRNANIFFTISVYKYSFFKMQFLEFDAGKSIKKSHGLNDTLWKVSFSRGAKLGGLIQLYINI